MPGFPMENKTVCGMLHSNAVRLFKSLKAAVVLFFSFYVKSMPATCSKNIPMFFLYIVIVSIFLMVYIGYKASKSPKETFFQPGPMPMVVPPGGGMPMMPMIGGGMGGMGGMPMMPQMPQMGGKMPGGMPMMPGGGMPMMPMMPQMGGKMPQGGMGGMPMHPMMMQQLMQMAMMQNKR